MLKIENLCCRVGKHRPSAPGQGEFLLNVSSLEVAFGEYFVLLGPTGSGKTTLAKCICGLYKNTDGKIFLRGRDITQLRSEERKIGYLPQNFALFPNMNVRENLLFAPSVRKTAAGTTKKSFDRIVEALNIAQILKRNPVNLSGGEKQRVALGRAFLSEPDILILDEPFSAIDTGLKTNLWFEMKEFLNEAGIPVIHITHNLDEAAVLAGNLAVLIAGRLVQAGSKDEIFSKPASEQVAGYLGIRNIYSGKITKADGGRIIIKGENFKITAFNDKNFKTGEVVSFSIREQDIKIIKEGTPVRDELKDNILEGEILASYFLSDSCIVKVGSAVNFELKFPAYIYQRHKLHNGKKVRIGIWQKGITVFRRPAC